jgi:hypothetical protein
MGTHIHLLWLVHMVKPWRRFTQLSQNPLSTQIHSAAPFCGIAIQRRSG